MKTGLYVPALLGCVVLATGCWPGEPLTIEYDVGGEPIIILNRLTPDTLFGMYALYRDLADGRLSYSQPASGSVPLQSASGLALLAEPGGRDLLIYFARCALASDETLVGVDEGTAYGFPGRLNLAPEWAYGPLSIDKRRRLSACVLAHVNGKGASVPISLRDADPNPDDLDPDGVAQPFARADAVERSAYPAYEGTFFGMIFGDGFRIYSCQGDGLGVLPAAVAPTRPTRVCTDNDPDCNVLSLGRCRDVCETHDDEYGWSDCKVGSGPSVEIFDETASVFLASDLRTDCHGSFCAYASSGGQGIYDCSGAGSCAITVQGSDAIIIDGSSVGLLSADVGDANAQIDCKDSGDCEVTCGEGSTCEVECRGSGGCDVACTGGSACVLDCSDADGSCGFSSCEGVDTQGVFPLTPTTCGGGVAMCNGACPAAAVLPTCGDATCEHGESCASCPVDCGACS